MVFELFQELKLQIYVSEFMTSWIISLPFVLLNLKSLEREKKYKKIEYLKNEKSFFNEIKGYNFVEKIKIWKKIADASFIPSLWTSFIACHLVQFQKNLMTHFRGHFKSIVSKKTILKHCTKNILFTQFWA